MLDKIIYIRSTVWSALVFLICNRKPGTPSSFLWRLGPVSRNSRDLSGLFRMPQFLYIFWTPRFYAIKLGKPLCFYYIKNILKDQLFKASRLKFDNWLFGPEKFLGLSRNRPLESKRHETKINIAETLVDDTLKLRQRGQKDQPWPPNLYVVTMVIFQITFFCWVIGSWF